MKIFLIGYEGSKHILPASSYLIKKYIPNEFEVNFLNFGDYDTEKLYRGNYVKLDETQVGGSSAWSKYLKEYFESIDDEYVIFALDDFFLCKELDQTVFDVLFEEMKSNNKVVCSKLGISPAYRPHEYEVIKENKGVEVFYLNSNAPYSSSTQYCIWERSGLIDLLSHTQDAWSFELSGSDYLNSTGQKIIGSTQICLPYSESSAVSNRQPEKVSVLGLTKPDIEDMITEEIIQEENLIVGQPIGSVANYSNYKDDMVSSLQLIEDAHYREYCDLVMQKTGVK